MEEKYSGPSLSRNTVHLGYYNDEYCDKSLIVTNLASNTLNMVYKQHREILTSPVPYNFPISNQFCCLFWTLFSSNIWWCVS